MNEHDSERIAESLRADGLERTDDLEEADVVVLNTCCIRENADTKLYGHLGHLKSLRDRKPELRIAVGGCLAQKDRDDLLRRAPHIDAVFGTHNVGRAPALLDRARREGRPVIEILEAPVEDADAFAQALPVRDGLPYAAWVTIQVGCNNSCAFCIVPSVRGPEQSRPFGELIDEVKRLSQSGTTEVTLLGQNVNTYGRDLASRVIAGDYVGSIESICGETFASAERRRHRSLFPDLLREIGAVEGIRRVRYTSPHPRDISSEAIAAMAETPAVCNQLHLPLQSGSDRVLRAMRRGYTAERYLERLAAARAGIEDLAVTTDIIVGFPGETDAEFEATLSLAAEARFDGAYTFIFSPRPGTRAAEMADEAVPAEVIAERFEALKRVVDRSALECNEARIGRIEEIVIEGPARRGEGLVSARTRHHKLVHLAADGLEPGRYGTARITSAGAHHLMGELVSIEDPPAVSVAPRRVKIPVVAS
jgi:tRNA-2-methylthio-N6-dimethylallyladenosine synthase